MGHEEWSDTALRWAYGQIGRDGIKLGELVEYLSAREKHMSEVKVAGEEAAVDLVAEYLDKCEEIKALQAAADDLKAEIVEALDAIGSPVGMKWTWVGLAEAQVCKGRTSEKLDRAVLARRGVSEDDLDAATVKSEGKPSLRITSLGLAETGAPPDEGL